ncbi:hypothetical protein M8997_009060 [Phyllobacterium sp. 21LDTY02-6]|uniref:hypothetical protein n=1 Tax=Phyllobacterium sp. 21LDTY02-6 TaxID=2944903 RepID=UPI002021C605|nr:hypothetical protein [Phyllobacterium sp. 21LDTY02-6]MCO4317329.1 hypothetical protein [Phyllobacterium sp. 21LDTY02-6]
MSNKDVLERTRSEGNLRRLGNLTKDDLVWIGSDGMLDPTIILAESGYDPSDPLSKILLAIIDAHPSTLKHSRIDRLESALSMLLGRERKRGMNDKDDHDYLMQIARLYFQKYIETGRTEPSLAPIIRQVIGSLKDKNSSEQDTLVRRLRGKFNANRDRYLVWATTEDDWNRMDESRLVHKAIEAMQALGIQVQDMN